MNKKILTTTIPIFAGLLLVLGVLSTNISAQEDSIPSWIKINAGFWSNNLISDADFLNGIQYLIEKEIIQVSYEIPQAVAQIETPPLTFYVVEGEWNDSWKLFCDVGDVVISGGSRIMFGEMWSQNSYPVKSSKELSYYDGWTVSFFGEGKGFRNAELYAICADTNL